jgi:hypothetical protein
MNTYLATLIKSGKYSPNQLQPGMNAFLRDGANRDDVRDVLDALLFTPDTAGQRINEILTKAAEPVEPTQQP